MEYSERLVQSCRALIGHSEHCKNEESTKQFLILPFVKFLGYDILNPDEVLPEQDADFSDRHKNKVDYVLKQGGEPIVAIEAKVAGADLKKNVGQLRGYFNAVKSIRVGIITDGLSYQCYTDTTDPNMMDERPFLSFSIKEIAEERFDPSILDSIGYLRKDSFDTGRIVQKAKENLLSNKVAKLLSEWIDNPPPDFVRLLLEHSEFDGKMTKRVLEENTPTVQHGLKTFIDRKLLERMGYADREVVKIDMPAESKGEEEAEPEWAIPTDQEQRVYEYATARLAFLSDNEDLFEKLRHVKFSALKHTFIVFYRQRNKGKLFNFRLQSNGMMEFQFPAIPEAGIEATNIETNNLSDIDDTLLQFFKCRALGKMSEGAMDEAADNPNVVPFGGTSSEAS